MIGSGGLGGMSLEMYVLNLVMSASTQDLPPAAVVRRAKALAEAVCAEVGCVVMLDNPPELHGHGCFVHHAPATETAPSSDGSNAHCNRCNAAHTLPVPEARRAPMLGEYGYGGPVVVRR